MSIIIKFPMSQQMVKRVGQRKSYERALLLTESLRDAEIMRLKSIKVLKEAEKTKEDMAKLFGTKK